MRICAPRALALGAALTFSAASLSCIQLGDDVETALPPGAPGVVESPLGEPIPALGSSASINGNSWHLVWQAEFEGAELDPGSWRTEEWGAGLYNHEFQAYTQRPENMRLEGGRLIIEARRDWVDGSEYSSGRITTDSRASWAYGRIEARMKLPGGVGVWPAFWLMGDHGGWPAGGEVDIMENVGWMGDTVTALAHSEHYNWQTPFGERKGTVDVPDSTTAFHTYAVEWFTDRLVYYVDDREYYVNSRENIPGAWPFEQPFHLNLNLAVGGDWGGARGVDPNIWPRRLEVEFVRVWQL